MIDGIYVHTHTHTTCMQAMDIRPVGRPAVRAETCQGRSRRNDCSEWLDAVHHRRTCVPRNQASHLQIINRPAPVNQLPARSATESLFSRPHLCRESDTRCCALIRLARRRIVGQRSPCPIAHPIAALCRQFDCQ